MVISSLDEPSADGTFDEEGSHVASSVRCLLKRFSRRSFLSLDVTSFILRFNFSAENISLAGVLDDRLLGGVFGLLNGSVLTGGLKDDISRDSWRQELKLTNSAAERTRDEFWEVLGCCLKSNRVKFRF